MKLRLSFFNGSALSEGLDEAVVYFLRRRDDFTCSTGSGFLLIDNNAAEWRLVLALGNVDPALAYG